ncbi:MAG: SRPBCC domain-containing protein [Microlunatus sp.]|nr:SRPBCC domain-containing protein [Microlunatus sp.]
MTNPIAHAVTDIEAGAEQVWAALTDPDQIAVYMGGSRVQTTWQVGSPITWSGEYDGRAYQDKGEVLRCDEPNVLSVTHYSPLMGQDDVPANYHTVTYTLSANDRTTRVSLTQDGCTDQAQAEQFSRNWQTMLDALKAHLESSRR